MMSRLQYFILKRTTLVVHASSIHLSCWVSITENYWVYTLIIQASRWARKGKSY